MVDRMKETLFIHVDFYADRMSRSKCMEGVSEAYGSVCALLRFAYLKSMITRDEYYTFMDKFINLQADNCCRIKRNNK